MWPQLPQASTQALLGSVLKIGTSSPTLGPASRADYSWGAGMWVTQMEGKQYSLCLFQFLHALCLCQKDQTPTMPSPPPAPRAYSSHNPALSHSNLSCHTTSRGRDTFYFQPQN